MDVDKMNEAAAVPPSDPNEPPSGSSPAREDAARHEVRRLHLLLLKREPDESDLARQGNILVSGEGRASDIVSELILRPEFGHTPDGINGSTDGPPSDNSDPAMLAYDEMVGRIFRLLLLRDPEESALAAFSTALGSGALDGVGMIDELVHGEEFGRAATKQPVVTRYIITSIARAVWGREPNESELNAYAQTIHEEDGLYTALHTLLGTDETIARHHAPVADTANLIPLPSQPEDIVHEIFNLLLFRNADESALQSFATSLTEARLGILDVVREVVRSEEFATTTIRFPAVSRQIAQTVLSTMMQREIEASMVDMYADAMEKGYSLQALLIEMLQSPEFLVRTNASLTGRKTDDSVTGGRRGPPRSPTMIGRGWRMGRRW